MSDGYTDTPFEDLIPPPTQIDDTHKDTSIAAAVIVLGILTHIVVIARLCQRYASRNMGADDYAIIPALLFYLGWTAMAAFFNLHSGLGKPIGDITYGEFITFFKGIFVAAWMYPIMTAAIRVSVILFYRRIFARGNTFYSLFISTMLVLQAAYVIVFEITPGFSCKPIRDGWNPILRLTSCSNFYIYQTEALYSISLAFDVILLIFPIYAVWKLQMPLKKRLGVAIIFALGAVASVVAAYKLAIFIYQSNNFAVDDPTWFEYQASWYMFPQYNSYGRTFWIPTQLEPTVALIGTSLPAMIGVYSAASLQFSKLRSRLTSSRRGSGSRDPYEHETKTGSNVRLRALGSKNAKFQQLEGSGPGLHQPSLPSMRSDKLGRHENSP